MGARLLLIFVAGGVGSVLRYGLATATQRAVGSELPAGTILVNVLGCLAIGLLVPLLTAPLAIREDYRFALIVGLLGGFTTFSAFAWESVTLASRGQWALAAANVILSNALGLGAAWVGLTLATRA